VGVGCGRIDFDPLGTARDVTTADGTDAPVVVIYASTDKTLYQIDPSTLVPTQLFDLSRSVPQICVSTSSIRSPATRRSCRRARSSGAAPRARRDRAILKRCGRWCASCSLGAGCTSTSA
jgi:hypothetical protein